MASLVLDEVGYQWFDGIRKNAQNPIRWREFAEGIKIRFGTTLRRPLEELVQLKQTGSLNEYQENFDRISCRSNLSEEQKLDCYLGCLKDEIAWDVRLFNPRTVLDTTRLAKIKEISLRCSSKGSTTSLETKKGTATAWRTAGTGQDQRGVWGSQDLPFSPR